MMGRELTPVDCSRQLSSWSVDGKRSVAERRSGRWNVQFRHVRRRSKTGPAVADPAAVISQVG